MEWEDGGAWGYLNLALSQTSFKCRISYLVLPSVSPPRLWELLFSSLLRASWGKSNQKCVHLGSEAYGSLEFWNILFFLTLEMSINLISTWLDKFEVFLMLWHVQCCDRYLKKCWAALARHWSLTTALLNQTLTILLGSSFSTWKFCPRTENLLCLHLEVALPGGIINLLSKCVSLHELSKQIPLEMWKALGNYLYNELKRQTVVRSVPVKQGNLQRKSNFLWKQWD